MLETILEKNLEKSVEKSVEKIIKKILKKFQKKIQNKLSVFVCAFDNDDIFRQKSTIKLIHKEKMGFEN